MVFVPLVVEVPVVLPWVSRKVVLPVLDCVAVPVILPWASLKVVLVPDVLVVVEAFFGESRCGGRDSSCGATKGIEQQPIREFGHGDFLVPGFVIQDGDKEARDRR